MQENTQKHPGQIVYGALARSYALTSGDPNWMNVTEFVIPEQSFDSLMEDADEPPLVAV